MKKLLIMVKIAPAILFAPLWVPLLMASYLVSLVPRINRQWGSWMFFQEAAFFRSRFYRRTVPMKRRAKTPATVDFLIFTALLHEGASWEQLEPLITPPDPDDKKEGPLPNWSYVAFETLFIDQKYEDALKAVQVWCEVTEERMRGREEDMSDFFARKGTDFSSEFIRQIITELSQERIDAWKENPQGKPHPYSHPLGSEEFFRNNTYAFYDYIAFYQAHLALELVSWLQKQDTATRTRAREAMKAAYHLGSMSLPRFEVNDGLARALGMDEATLVEARRRAMGS